MWVQDNQAGVQDPFWRHQRLGTTGGPRVRVHCMACEQSCRPQIDIATLDIGYEMPILADQNNLPEHSLQNQRTIMHLLESCFAPCCTRLQMMAVDRWLHNRSLPKTVIARISAQLWLPQAPTPLAQCRSRRGSLSCSPTGVTTKGLLQATLQRPRRSRMHTHSADHGHPKACF
jgi:hypothetical protein